MMNKKVETNEEMLNEVNGGIFPPYVLRETIIAETATDSAITSNSDEFVTAGRLLY
jgi:hypothetical protein